MSDGPGPAWAEAHLAFGERVVASATPPPGAWQPAFWELFGISFALYFAGDFTWSWWSVVPFLPEVDVAPWLAAVAAFLGFAWDAARRYVRDGGTATAVTATRIVRVPLKTALARVVFEPVRSVPLDRVRVRKVERKPAAATIRLDVLEAGGKRRKLRVRNVADPDAFLAALAAGGAGTD